MKYTESFKEGNKYRRDYLNSITELINMRQRNADEKRATNIRKIVCNQDEYREKLKEMLGWPLCSYNNNIPKYEKDLITQEDGINVYRMQIEILDKIKFYGIFFEHNEKKNLPLIICQHGGLGTPEICSGLFESTANYNEMTERVLKNEVNVFAPQLLLWDEKASGICYDRNDIDVKLKQVGASIASIEIYAIMKSIDCLSTFENVNSQQIGMVGLSYGGFYTLYTTAIDKRIRGAISCSWYNDRYKYARGDWVWFNSANKILDNEVALLVYPRYLCIEVGDKDEIFTVDGAIEKYNELKEIEKDWCDFVVFDGTHEFCKSDIYIKKLIQVIKQKN